MAAGLAALACKQQKNQIKSMQQTSQQCYSARAGWLAVAGRIDTSKTAQDTLWFRRDDVVL